MIDDAERGPHAADAKTLQQILCRSQFRNRVLPSLAVTRANQTTILITVLDMNFRKVTFSPLTETIFDPQVAINSPTFLIVGHFHDRLIEDRQIIRARIGLFQIKHDRQDNEPATAERA